MLNLNCSVTIGGSDYTDYVISITRKHSICEGMATGTIELAPGAPLPTTYDEIVIEEIGTKVFTGFVTDTTKGRMPVEYNVNFADPVIKMADYWTTELYESTGETAEYWIGFFCDLVGVSYQFDATYSRTVPSNIRDDGVSWQYSSVLTIVRELLVIGGFYMWSDADGVIHFSNVDNGANGNTPGILSFRREQGLSYARNKATVFGKYPIVQSATTTVPNLSWEKTAIVASPYIEDDAYALDLANQMLTHFGKASDVKYLQIIGIPSLRVGQTLPYTDSWIGISGTGLVTSFSSRMGNSGYTMDVVLDEFCPFIWGYSLRALVLVYAGTDGRGVWRTLDLGLTWTDITNNIPSGSWYVRGITASGGIVWAATISGVYYTMNGDATTSSGVVWEDKTPTPLPSGVTLTDWTDVEIDPADINTVFVLMDDLINHKVYMHKTDDNGSSWSNVEVA